MQSKQKWNVGKIAFVYLFSVPLKAQWLANSKAKQNVTSSHSIKFRLSSRFGLKIHLAIILRRPRSRLPFDV
jgi:hypothetical protein